MTRGQLGPKNGQSQQEASCQRACNGKKTQQNWFWESIYGHGPKPIVRRVTNDNLSIGGVSGSRLNVHWVANGLDRPCLGILWVSGSVSGKGHRETFPYGLT